jgi:hypothetical protein
MEGEVISLIYINEGRAKNKVNIQAFKEKEEKKNKKIKGSRKNNIYLFF